MVYLEYDIKSGLVIEIYNEIPALSDGYDYCISNDFKINDEFEKTIWINDVDEDRNIISYSSIKNNQNTSIILRDNKILKNKINEYGDTILELKSLMEAILGGDEFE